MNDVPPPPPPPYGAVPPGGGSPQVGAALSYGFNKYFANIGPVLAVIFISIAVQIALSLIGQVVVRSLIGIFVFQILGWVVGAIAALGIYKMALMLTAPTLKRSAKTSSVSCSGSEPQMLVATFCRMIEKPSVDSIGVTTGAVRNGW